MRFNLQSVDEAKSLKISIFLNELFELRVLYFGLASHQPPDTLKEAMERANAEPKEGQTHERQKRTDQGRGKWALKD
ncbi:hypothetical protein OR16_30734 [Cupriavidus basilensis OR16]|uniref:Uncharacterized protein n=1 Tax=Cupriavidus basilensis OR16 TaxID=1127483 RepID=H1SD27_9BURK|nr:hypothetical protein OR16_30734 [Cupriavidus basilensis OR16]